MFYQKRVVVCLLVSIVTVASAAITIEKARPNKVPANRPDVTGNAANPIALSLNQPPPDKARNLSLQPEAFRLSKKLGLRFANAQRSISVITGTLTFGSKPEFIKLTRRQNKRGERVELEVATERSLLTWDEAEGPKSTARAVSESERDLIERFIFDSADQFVLAQLRGASYYTVGRSVRPAEAGDSDSYSGPLWTIVQVTDPDEDNRRKPQSKSRLYFINESTGLIDKVVAEAGGDKIEATFSGWTSRDGETIPTRIVWNRNGRTIMEFSMKTFGRLSAQ